MKEEHLSNSETQNEIERIIVESLDKECNCVFSKKAEGLKFEFDLFNKEKRIIGEIYAGIDKISSGSIRKVQSDCFKLVFAEKKMGGEWNKLIIFVDDNIQKKFEGDSWIKEAIDFFGIELKTIQLSEENKNKLRKAKKRQQIGNQTKKN